MKCQHPDCAIEASQHPVISFAFNNPSRPRASVHLLMPLCALHAQHDPADAITDNAYESLCAMLKERDQGRPVRDSITVSFEPYSLMTPTDVDDPLSGLLKVAP